MEAGADLQHAGDAAVDLDPPLAWLGDPAQHFQQCRLSGAVAADDADDLAALDLERHVLERPEILHGRPRTVRYARAEQAANPVGDHIAQRDIPLAPLMADAIFLAQALDPDAYVGHRGSLLHPIVAAFHQFVLNADETALVRPPV